MVVITPSSAERKNHNVKTTDGTLFESNFLEHFISSMADHYSFSVQKIRFLNHAFKLFNSPIVIKYDGVSRLEIFLFPYVLQWLPEVSEHPREPYGNTSFSRRSHYLNFRRNATNFCLELAR